MKDKLIQPLKTSGLSVPYFAIEALSTKLLCSTYDDEIWRQSFLCGRASRVEQFASGSSSRGQFTLF